MSELIAEVHQIALPSGVTTPSDEVNKIADEAAHAPGSEQLLTMVDTGTGEGFVIHLWKDRAAYDAWSGRRREMTAEAEGSGSKIESGRLYEVTYRS